VTWPLPTDTDEYYGMPSFPVIETIDLEASARWYHALGFRHVFTLPGPAGRTALVHLRWARYADVLLRPGGDATGGPRGSGITLTFAMVPRSGETVDDVAERARSLGATIAEAPTDRPWNSRETTILDPDGYRLGFTQPIDASGAVTMEEIVERVTRSDADGHATAAKEHAPT